MSARNYFRSDCYGLIDYHFDCEETGRNGSIVQRKTLYSLG